MAYFNKRGILKKLFPVFTSIIILSIVSFSCSSFNYITYDKNDQGEDPEPNYAITLNPSFQEFTNYMFIGNRIENFGTYFNTFFNASENYKEGYDICEKKVLSHYSERLDSILINPALPIEAQDDFNKTIEKASKVIQYHKSSAFMDRAVLLIGKSYFYLGGENYLKAERKFNEFISRLQMSPLIEEAYLYLAKTQLRLHKTDTALVELNKLISTSTNNAIISGSYQSLAEYYISQKDYESAITDYQKSLELSTDNSFQAQLQFIIATIISQSNPSKGSEEYIKVLDYSTSYDLEYLARYNSAKYAILGNNFNGVLTTLEKLEVKYKDDQSYLPQILYLRGLYYEQKKDFKNAQKEYLNVIQTYPKTVSSSDASYSVAKFYENISGDYLSAFRFYRYSTEENRYGHSYYQASEKTGVFKRYFGLKSVIAGNIISTDYDSLFYNLVLPKGANWQNQGKGNDNKGGENKKREDKGNGGSYSKFYSDSTRDKKVDRLNMIKGVNTEIPQKDSLKNENMSQTDSLSKLNESKVDSAKIREESILNAKFELSELFMYDLYKPDSAEAYLKEAFDGSENPEFKSKVLFTLANLYRTENKNDKSNETFKKLIDEYPLSSLSNEARKLLGISQIDLETHDALDSVFNNGENSFSDKDYTSALAAFQYIVASDTSSKYFLRSAYAAGWIYENISGRPDSALIYYNKILNSDPSSDITKLVTTKLIFYKQEKTKEEDSSSHKTDSLKLDSLKFDSSSNIHDTLNFKSPGNNKEELKNGEGNKSNDETGDQTGKDKNNPDLKKEEGTVPDPDKK